MYTSEKLDGQNTSFCSSSSLWSRRGSRRAKFSHCRQGNREHVLFLARQDPHRFPRRKVYTRPVSSAKKKKQQASCWFLPRNSAVCTRPKTDNVKGPNPCLGLVVPLWCRWPLLGKVGEYLGKKKDTSSQESCKKRPPIPNWKNHP